MIWFVFPSKFEAEGLLANLAQRKTAKLDGLDAWTGKIADKLEAGIAVIGIGPKAAATNVQKLLEQEQVQTLILAGFGGALSTQLTRGQIIIANNHSSEALINYLRLLPGFDLASVYTAERLAVDAEEKAELAKETESQMVDMETSVVAHVASHYGVEFMAVRVVSDLADEAIPADVLAHGYHADTGLPDPRGITLFLLTHPNRIKAFRKFMQQLPPCRDALTKFLLGVANELS